MKTLILLTLLVFSSHVSAQSCWDLYRAEADKINKEDGYTESVGGQFYVAPGGQIGYWPGVKVAADIDNWAEDFVNGVKYGPYIMTYKPDPRLEILETFYKDIDDECSLPKDNHDRLRSMLQALMDDGSFCPEGKILDRPFFGRWKHYKRVLREAVKGGRFQDLCHGVAVHDDSDREIKDASTPSKERESDSSSASEQ